MKLTHPVHCLRLGHSKFGLNTAKFAVLTVSLLTGFHALPLLAQSTPTPLIGFDTNGQPGGSGNFGSSPLAPSVTAANLVAGSLTRGAGVGTTGTGAARGFGGNTFNSADAATADAAGQNFTFTLTPTSGNALSLANFDQLNYRRSGTGPSSAVLSYEIGSGNFIAVSTLSLTSTASAGANLAPVDLSGISALQGVQDSVTFRITPFGGSSPAGTFYIFDVANSTAADLDVTGTVNPVPEPSTTAFCIVILAALIWNQRRRFLLVVDQRA